MRIPHKYVVVFLVFLFTCGCIYAFNVWHQQRRVKEPLAETLLQIEGVGDVELINDGRKETEVCIVLDAVDNLPKTYNRIEEALSSAYKKDSYIITLTDNRDPYLESVYTKIHFALMEGERMGNYGAMSKEVFRQLEQEKDLKNYNLWVDQKRIYLLLATSKSNLYEVIPVKYSIGVGQVA
ncbi:MAG: hypothetical protein GX334_08075 [Firmicutes bacterium]|nr:hypothetical protein [Bacillota bacterium]